MGIMEGINWRLDFRVTLHGANLDRRRSKPPYRSSEFLVSSYCWARSMAAPRRFRLAAGLVWCMASLLTVSSLWSQQPDLPHDLSFVEALQIAESSSPALLASQHLVDIAVADARAASRRNNPVLAFEGEEYAAFDTVRPGFWEGQALIVGIHQELETAGQRQLRKRASRMFVEESQSVQDDTRRRMLLEVGRTYFGLVLANANLIATQDMVRDLDQVIGLTESRVSVGESAGMDLRRLLVERLHVMDELFAAEEELSAAQVGLLYMLGAPNGNLTLDTLDPLDPPPLYGSDGAIIASRFGVSADMNELLRYALESRPDLQATRHARDRAQTEVALQRRMQIPDIAVGVGYRSDFGDGHLDFGIEIPFPLFGGVNAGGRQRAIARISACGDDGVRV